ncbi:hypothetical protein HYW42_02855 [Candidatus Daviesbacteria bacterium]|nr:hypothetical protein [Candidatus Daviesbacteria bacterium]
MQNHYFSKLRVNLSNLESFFIGRNSLQLFLILIPIVALIQFSLLNIILKYGFTADEWLLLFDFNTIGSSGDFLERVFAIFRAKGIYTSYQVLYIGILAGLFKDNYQAYQLTNIIFKILAILSLFPLIAVVFKRRLLAFLTTIFYALSYSSTGALQFVVKGSDYLAIFFMNIYLLTHYYSLKKKSKSFLFFTAIMLFLSFMFSPIRIYPLLFFVVIFEVFVWTRAKGFLGLWSAFFRLAVILSPFIMLMLLLPKATGSYLEGPLVIYKLLTYGNYQLLLSPFAGLGYTFLTNDYWPLFGQIILDSFKEYFFFLLRGPIIFYSALTVLIGFLITKRPIFFILGVILANVIFEITCYFLINNVRLSSGPNIKGFYLTTIYAIFFGFFCLSIGFASLIVWLKHKQNILLLSLLAGPFFSSIFLWGTWLIIGDSLTFKEGIHWYLIIPPIGSSLFLASLMVLGFDRIKKVTNSYLKWVLITFLFLTLLPMYQMGSKEISTTFSYLLSIGYGASDQELMKGQVEGFIKEPFEGKPALFYLDTSENNSVDPLFYPVTLISGFDKKMHFRNWDIVKGCIGLILDKTILEKSMVMEEGVKGFKVRSLCIEDNFFTSNDEIFYKLENFYALKFIGKDVSDNTKRVLDDLKY